MVQTGVQLLYVSLHTAGSSPEALEGAKTVLQAGTARLSLCTYVCTQAHS